MKRTPEAGRPRFSACCLFLSTLVAAQLLLMTAASGAQQIEQSVESLTSQILESLQARGATKVAVVELTDLDGAVPPLGRLIAEELTSELFKQARALPPGTLTLVERSKLEEVLGEQRLGVRGLLEKQNVETFGRVLGVEAILTGTFAPLQDRIRVNARLIAVPSAELFATASGYLSRLGLPDRYFLSEANVSEGQPLAQERSSPGTSAGRAEAPALQTQELAGVRFELLGCKASGIAVTCSMRMTSVGSKDRLLTSLDWPPPRLVDDEGNECTLKRLQAGATSAVGPDGAASDVRLLAGVPLRAELAFEGLSQRARSVSLIELSGETVRIPVSEGRAQNPFRLQFRNVRLLRP